MSLGLPKARVYGQPEMVKLIPVGQFFKLATGARFTVIGASDFNLLSKFILNQDILPTLQQRKDVGFNWLRVWTAFDIPGIGRLIPAEHPDYYDKLQSFLNLCQRYGFYIELTAYTGINDPLHWDQMVSAIGAQPNVVFDLVNELDQNTNEPDYLGRVFDITKFGRPPGSILAAHGSNGSEHWPVRPVWSFETFHTNGASEWWRKVGHNAMEIADNSHEPVVSDENTRFPDSDSSTQHAYDAAAGAALLCAGSVYHSVRGKLSELWDGIELACAIAWAQGAKSVELEYQDGLYEHHPELEGDIYIRVYARRLPDGRRFYVKIRK